MQRRQREARVSEVSGCRRRRRARDTHSEQARSSLGLTNDSKATVSVLYWYGNYPTHSQSKSLTFWILAWRKRWASSQQREKQLL